MPRHAVAGIRREDAEDAQTKYPPRSVGAQFSDLSAIRITSASFSDRLDRVESYTKDDESQP